MSHPDLLAPPDTRPIEVGEVWQNPVTRERGLIVELPWLNDEGRLVSELTWYRSYPPGARVVGEHMHPALVERLSVEDGELRSCSTVESRFSEPVSRRRSSRACGTTGGTRPTGPR